MRESPFQHNRPSLQEAGELISSLLTTLKQNQVKVAPCFRRQNMAASTDTLATRLDCRVRTSRRIGRIFDSGRGVLSSASTWRVSTTPLSPANWTSLAWSCTTSMISSSTSAKRSVAWRNSPLHELLCVSQKVACLTCALICDWKRHLDCQSVVVANACAARLSISFVVNDTAELEVDPAIAPSFCLREQCGCGWAVCIGWLDGKERREHTKSM